jgi:hypothetical protein
MGRWGVMMPYVGVRKSDDGYTLTDPLSSESTTVKLPSETIAEYAHNLERYQDHLAELYRQTPGRFKSLFHILMNENPMWHIHGIVAVAAISLGIITASEPVAIPLLTSGGAALWSLFKRVRPYKACTALALALTYAYVSVWLIAEQLRPASIVTSLTLSLISMILVVEWSRNKTYISKKL